MKHKHFKQKNKEAIQLTVENPSRKIFKLLISMLFLILTSIVLLSCANEKKEKAETTTLTVTKAHTPQTNPVATSQITYEIVPNDKVCMVNDRFMGVEQIPIDVEGTTYYGCCQGCVDKLQKNIDNVRFGSNPINDVKVDKANAVIVQDKSKGSVYYFASKQDAQSFINNN
ncbi:MAG: hypothetical protein CMB99_13255 [Flavobacteriaceae bacterium]|nr:hypothetical protein [Flavobacteriaceae bacterium]|tara:strand:+ start:2159 stop:2671 length:513 start_codon:yes stop_codon:yes gene_type:complete